MNTYVTEEEQIEAIRRWWNKHGNLVSTVILVIALCIVSYRWYENHQLETKVKASQAFEQLMRAYAENDDAGIKAHANYLDENYSGTVYATGAKLILGRLNANAGQLDKAKEDLNWVVSHASANPIKQLAAIRLARIEAEQKHYDKALSYLHQGYDDSFKSLRFEIQGDIYLAKGNQDEAKRLYVKAKMQLPKEYRGNNTLLSMKINQISTLNMIGKPVATKTKNA